MDYVIGISGKAGHGKDSLAGFLGAAFHHDKAAVSTRSVSFAEKLKRITADILDVDYYYVDDGAGKLKEIKHMGGVTGRKADQVVGTDVARKIYSDVWIYHYNKRIRELLSYECDHDVVILTADVRFENEYEYVKNIGRDIGIKSVLIRVVRPGFSIDHGSEHSSETALDHIDDWDHKIVAEDLIELQRRAEEVYKLIVK